MKMKVSTRLIFTVYLLVVIAFCLFLLSIIFGVLPAANLTQSTAALTGDNMWVKALYVIIFLVMVVVGFCLLFFGIKKEKLRTAVIATLDSGTISIAINALEDLAKKFVKQTGSVRGEGIKVLSLGDQIDLDVKISILPEVSIPQITQDMQIGLIQYIENYSGIKVKQAKIIVTSINESIKENKTSGVN